MIDKKIPAKVGLNVLNIKPKKEINIIIFSNNKKKEFRLRNKINYYFIVNCTSQFIDVSIERVYNQKTDIENEVLEELSTFYYGQPNQYEHSGHSGHCETKYPIVYSFDSNYFSGAFASIYSLIKNFDKSKLKYISLNLCIPETDFDLADINMKKFIDLTAIKIKYTLIFVNEDVINDEFKTTKCYKGGNHLLKISNFSRLIVSNFINYDKLLYLDSDTIVQTDMAKILDNIPKENTFAFIGKKAELTFNNLINSTNKKIVLDFLGNDFDLDKNIIYTGTMILNTSIIRNKFSKMVNLVKAHNETKGGIYKLFTMSIINLGMVGNIGYFDDYLKNIVDLGFKEELEDEIEKSDVLDWSGMYKPWFCNGLYREYWMKYNIMFDKSENYVMYNKDTVEKNLS